MEWRIPQLSVAMAGLGAAVEPSSPSARRESASASTQARELIITFASAGAAGVQLDATRAGIRPRELDRSARRDLALLLKQRQLRLSGVDCLIPPAHFADPASAERAVQAALAAIDLCADLRSNGPGESAVADRLNVCIHTGVDTPSDVLAAIAARGELMGIAPADLRWPALATAESAPARTIAAVKPGQLQELSSLGVAIDPASVLAGGGDPCAEALKLGERLTLARVSDAQASLAGARTAPGHRAARSSSGRLDLAGYVATLASMGYRGMAVLDLRGVPGANDAFAASISAWNTAVGTAGAQIVG